TLRGVAAEGFLVGRRNGQDEPIDVHDVAPLVDFSDTGDGTADQLKGIGAPLTAQLTPKRSVNMPKVCAQNAGARGIVTWPPSASAWKALCAWSTLSTCSASITPWMPACG